MTNKELQAALKKFPDDIVVCTNQAYTNDNSEVQEVYSGVGEYFKTTDPGGFNNPPSGNGPLIMIV